ncbi:MAG: SGNH/GDSL hydrolase family protein [Verrucomicrobia bacterium]|jgi:hypothetical protein|nr:SGNH/GDSL hydrolase family protein [Verrucomicrobiota bacterium]
MNGTSGRNVRKGIAVLFLILAAICLAIVIAIAYRGGRFEWTLFGIPISAGNPKGRLLCIPLALLASHLCWRGFRRSPKEWGTLAGRLILLSISVSISLLVAEVGLRISLKQGESSGSMQDLADLEEGSANVAVSAAHPLAAVTCVSANKKLVYELRSNQNMKFGNRELRTNRAGIRADRDYTIEKPPSTVRIIGLGDSGMWGWSVHQHELYMALLEKSLGKRSGKTYEVLNLAVPGYNTFQEVEMLRHKGLAYNPDIVVINWCRNDPDAPFFASKPRTYDSKEISYVWLLLFDRAQFKRETAPIVMKAGEVDKAFVDPVILEHSGWKGVKRSLAELKQLGQEHGFRILVYGPLTKEISAILADLNLEHFDTYELRQEDYPNANIHGMHPRPEANRIHAEFIEKELDRRGWL